MITPTLQMGTLRHREHYSLSRGCTLRNQDLNHGSVVSEYSFITTVFYPLNSPMLSRFYSAFQSVCLSLVPQLTCTAQLRWEPVFFGSQPRLNHRKAPGMKCLALAAWAPYQSSPPGHRPQLICLKSSFFLSLLCFQTCSHGSI